MKFHQKVELTWQIFCHQHLLKQEYSLLIFLHLKKVESLFQSLSMSIMNTHCYHHTLPKTSFLCHYFNTKLIIAQSIFMCYHKMHIYLVILLKRLLQKYQFNSHPNMMEAPVKKMLPRIKDFISRADMVLLTLCMV